MTSVYDKALKRCDVSGSFKKEKDGPEVQGRAKKWSSFSTNRQASGKKDKSTDDASSADIGKIVNLMSGDANRVAIFVSSAYFFYGAPFEIIIACIFLYKYDRVLVFFNLVLTQLTQPFGLGGVLRLPWLGPDGATQYLFIAKGGEGTNQQVPCPVLRLVTYFKDQ